MANLFDGFLKKDPSAKNSPDFGSQEHRSQSSEHHAGTGDRNRERTGLPGSSQNQSVNQVLGQGQGQGPWQASRHTPSPRASSSPIAYVAPQSPKSDSKRKKQRDGSPSDTIIELDSLKQFTIPKKKKAKKGL